MIRVYTLISKDPITLEETDRQILLSAEERVKLEIDRRLIIGEITYAPLFRYTISGNKFVAGVYRVIDNDKQPM